MKIIIKKDIIDNNVVIIPKNTEGFIKAYQWGDKGEFYIVDFPTKKDIVVPKSDAIIVQEKKKIETE